MTKLILIKYSSKGEAVRKWQYFLRGQNLYMNFVDGKFGEATKDATIKFQLKHHLQPDGIVGIKTYGAAMLLNFDAITDNDDSVISQNWPEKPAFNALTDHEKQTEFGIIEYNHTPQPNNFEHITITNDWENQNMKSVQISQLEAYTPNGKVYLHKRIEKQFAKLFEAWELAGLMHHIITWDGMYDPRLIRGRNNLSCHAFGIAFDINAKWNGLGTMPALVGQKGCVRELVALANEHGFFWGGHFMNRKDGMHFEVAKIITR